MDNIHNQFVMTKKSQPAKKARTKKPAGDTKKSLIGRALSTFRQYPGKLLNYKQLSKLMGITDDETRKLLNSCLNELSAAGEIEEPSRGKFRMQGKEELVTGTIDLTNNGAAFVVVDGKDEDIYVAASKLRHALNGDTVTVRITSGGGRKHCEGEVVEIVKRRREQFVGIVEISKHYAFLVPDKTQMPYDIFIPLDKLNNAQRGQKAVAKIVEWTERQKNPIGEIIEVLGNVGDNNTEMHAILAEFGLPYRFPKRVEDAAAEVDETISEQEIARRRDFRQVTTFTIDPADAKDFDDAISFRRLADDRFEVGVHIADVTFYVRPNTALEKEAYSRATSVYLVDRTVPMLPEKLSNKVCSLRPNEEKLCFSAVFELDADANVLTQWFGRTVINSDHRFAYEDAQQVIETKEGPLADELMTLNDLAQKLRKKRFAAGAISFERSEVKFQLDEEARPIGVYLKEQKEANQLIEEFMLLANRKVAEFVGKPAEGKGKRTFVYRIHGEPNSEKLTAFAQFIKRFGYQLQTKTKKKIASSINSLLTDVNGKAEQTVVETLAIRTMARAEYSTKNIGHYGLAFDYYTHFTSPIRRYPDMMVHRLLAHYLENGKSVDADAYEAMCKHSSEMEQLATSAERASIKYKQVEFMKDNVGKIFDGVISGVTQWGIYVELNDSKCEGMVSIRTLTDDHYEYDEAEFAVIGRRTKRRYTMGDSVSVRVVAANMEKKQLDFEIVRMEIPFQ